MAERNMKYFSLSRVDRQTLYRQNKKMSSKTVQYNTKKIVFVCINTFAWPFTVQMLCDITKKACPNEHAYI